MVLRLTFLKTKSSNLMFCLFVLTIISTAMYYSYKKTAIDYVPQRLHKYLKSVNKTVVNDSLDVLSAKLDKLNELHEVKNWDTYGPLESDTTSIVILVHRDMGRLQHLIVSLAQVKDIQMVLLIFSHSFYDENINHLIQQIDFCMVTQIFYSNSVQLFPNKFPEKNSGNCTNGTRDANDCRPKHDAQSAESKHHWWWTANVVFDQLSWANNNNQMVLFIHEDSYVLPDFLHMLRVSQLSLSYVTDAIVLSFGRPLMKDLDSNKLTVQAWRPPYDKGLAFNLTTWRKIVTLGKHYCDFGDTSWSYSLSYLFEHLPQGHAVTVACMAPRVVSTGMFCDGSQALKNIWTVTRKDLLFPKKVQVVVLFGRDGMLFKKPRAPLKGNGGWSNDLDRLLCYRPQILNVTLYNLINNSTPSSL